MEYRPVAPPITDIQVISGMIIAFVLVFVAVVYRRKEKIVSFSIAWFFINYLPVSNIYPLNTFFAEHWIYTPSLGLFILAGWVAAKICRKSRILRQLGCLVLAILLAGNFYLTAKQNQCWENPEDFYKRTLSYAPKSSKIYFRLGLLYLRSGELDKGIENTKKALEISPNFVSAYKHLVSAYIKKGSYDKAIEVCQKGLELDPDSYIFRNNLGIAYAAKDYNEQAVIEFRKAIAINPDYSEAYSNLGSTYAIIGRVEEATVSFRKALEINPGYATAHSNLARAYYEQKQYDLAIKHCDRAIALGFKVEPDFLELLEPFRK